MAKVIGICGGSGSGKTTIVRRIQELVGDLAIIPQDSYYRSADNVSNRNITGFNFDHPSAFDTELIVEHLASLREGKAVDVPQYDFVHHRRKAETTRVEPGKLVLFEGILIYADPRLLGLIDLKLYVDTPDDIRFIRRLQRDVEERGRTVDSVVTQYLEVVRPGHYQFVEPTKVHADLIVPEGGSNEKALEVLGSFIRDVVK